MAVEMIESKGLWKKFQGVAADVKPEDDLLYRVGNGSEFYKLDTKKTFQYSINNDVLGVHWIEK